MMKESEELKQKKAEEEQKEKQEKEEEEEEDSEAEERRIQAMKEAILKQKQEQTEKITQIYSENPDLDLTQGRCCFCIEHNRGARYIHRMDIIFVPNLFRWIYAVWAKVDHERYPLYSRVRVYTFWFFWIAVLALVIGIVADQIFSGEQQNTAMLYVNSIFGLSALCVAILSDFHFNKIIKYQASIQEKLIAKERRAKERRRRAQERYLFATGQQIKD